LVLKTFDENNTIQNRISTNITNEGYQIKGPFGFALNPSKSGLNIAFCEGNGIIVFLDLVTYIAGKMLNMTDDQTTDGFKLILFVQFENWENSIAMNFLDLVNDLSKKLDSAYFELVLNVKSIDKQPWT
jgi:hypothetical protein